METGKYTIGPTINRNDSKPISSQCVSGNFTQKTDTITKRLDELAENLKILCERIDPILTHNMTEDSDKICEPESESRFDDFVYDTNIKISNLTDYVKNVINRVTF